MYSSFCIHCLQYEHCKDSPSRHSCNRNSDDGNGCGLMKSVASLYWLSFLTLVKSFKSCFLKLYIELSYFILDSILWFFFFLLFILFLRKNNPSHWILVGFDEFLFISVDGKVLECGKFDINICICMCVYVCVYSCMYMYGYMCMWM